MRKSTSREGDTWRTTYEVLTRDPFPFGIPAITPRQLRLSLYQKGLLTGVEAALASLPEPQKSGAAIEWEYSSQFLRDHPMVNAIASALGVDSKTLDEIFINGSSL